METTKQEIINLAKQSGWEGEIWPHDNTFDFAKQTKYNHPLGAIFATLDLAFQVNNFNDCLFESVGKGKLQFIIVGDDFC